MNERYTCHVKILADEIVFPDPDGDGIVTAVKGETRLIIYDDAKPLEAAGAVKILSEDQAAALGLS